jgi:hypothetical protein
LSSAPLSELDFLLFIQLDILIILFPRESLALFANGYCEGSQSTSRVLTTIRAGNLPAIPARKNRCDFPNVHLWTRKEFRCKITAQKRAQQGDTDGNAISAPQKRKPGRPRKASIADNNNDDEDLLTGHFYLESADGIPVSDEEITEMSRKARMLWRTLHEDGLAPSTFGKISMKAWEYFASMILSDKAFEFLLLCDDSEWKLREWSTRSYPSWHHNRFNKDADDDPIKGEASII